MIQPTPSPLTREQAALLADELRTCHPDVYAMKRDGLVGYLTQQAQEMDKEAASYKKVIASNQRTFAEMEERLNQQAQEIERLQKQYALQKEVADNQTWHVQDLTKQLATAQAQLNKYAHWTPEHTIEEWLADRQRIVDAKQVEADTQLQATLAAREAELAVWGNDQKAACGELLVSLDDSPPGSLVNRLVIANRVLRSNLTAAVQRAEQAEARVAELEGGEKRVPELEDF